MQNGLFNIAIAGCGMISGFHLAALAEIPAFRVAGVWDILPEAAAGVAGRYGVRAYRAYEDILADPAVDAVDICLPSGLHAEYGIQAAKAGKHVIVEKPLDVTREAVDGLVRACREAGVTLAGILPYRFAPSYLKVKQALDEGLLGRPIAGEAAIKWYRDEKYYASSNWKGTRRLDGGGALMNQGIHMIDMLLWYLGEAVSAASLVRTARHRIEVEDLAVAVVEFRNGAVGTITGATALKPGFPERVEVYGEKGAVALEGGRVVRWRVDGCREEDYLDPPATHSSSADPAGITAENHRRQFQAIAEAYRQGAQPPVAGEEAGRAVRFILALYEADGRWVEIGTDTDLGCAK
ncbi:MAG: Gfo/Idh/MocA family protein [Patescibacteria group bacterium]